MTLKMKMKKSLRKEEQSVEVRLMEADRTYLLYIIYYCKPQYHTVNKVASGQRISQPLREQ